MARKRSSKLPTDPSEPALPSALKVLAPPTPPMRLDERAMSAPSLSDLTVPDPRPEAIVAPVPVPRVPTGDPITPDELFDYPAEPEQTSEEDRRKLAKRLAQEAMDRIKKTKPKAKSSKTAKTTAKTAKTTAKASSKAAKSSSKAAPKAKTPRKKPSLSDRAKRTKSASEAIDTATPVKKTAKKKPRQRKAAQPKSVELPKASTKPKKNSAVELEAPAHKPKKRSEPVELDATPNTPVELDAPAPAAQETAPNVAVELDVPAPTAADASALEEVAAIRPALPQAVVAPIVTPPVVAPPAASVVAAPVAPVVAAPVAMPTNPAAALNHLGDVTVLRTLTVDNRALFSALWTAHSAHARHGGDVTMAAMASVLLDAGDRLPTNHLVAFEVTIADKSYAVWVDAGRECVLAIASPPVIYLAGL